MEALRSKEEAAEALKTFAHKTALMGALVLSRDKAVLAIQEKHQPGITTLCGELTTIEEQLRQWAETNPDLFGEARSLEFSYGFLKFRTGQRKLVLLARWTWDKVLAVLLEKPVTSQWQEYIRRDPEINKRKLLEATKDGGNLPEAKLRDIGCRVIREEGFSIETKPEMVTRDCDTMP
jgi:phage host-nuclease inhibitor protein Gam